MSTDSLESGELLLEEGELPQEEATSLPPRNQQPRGDGGGGWRRSRSRSPLGRPEPPFRGPPHRGGSRGEGGGWGHGPGPGSRRSRSPPPPPFPGRGPYPGPPFRGGPRGPPPPRGPSLYDPLPPSPVYDRPRSGSRPQSPRQRSRSRPRSPPPLPPRDVSPPPRAHSAQDEASRDARELDHLASNIRALCRSLTLQECLKDLGRVCRDLGLVVERAAAYLRILRKRDESLRGADDSEELAGLTAGLVAGLKALHVFSNTGQGRHMPAAREPVQAAWKAREELFTETQRRQLDGFVSSSRNFASLLEERPPSPQQPVRRTYVPAPRPQPQQKERKNKRAAAEEEAGADDAQLLAVSKRQLRRMQQAQRAEEEAAKQAEVWQQQAEQTARLQQQIEARRKAAEEAEAARKQYKLTIRLGTSSLPGEPAAPPPAAAEPAAPTFAPPAQRLAPAPEEAALAAALDDHWRWHQQQSAAAGGAGSAAVQQQQGGAGGGTPPPLPPEDGPAGWQAVKGTTPAVAPLSPMSAPASPAANGSAAGLNSAALEHAADGSSAVRELLGQGKLCLVLDLDHTLLNSATFGEVAPPVQAALEGIVAHESASLPDDQRLLFRMDGIKMWTKLRPAVREFLQRSSRLFQLWIHTNGNRAYADSVVRLLDPSGALFGDRIIAQGAERVDQMVADQEKRLMQGLAEREAITVIVDDSHSVWHQHRHNLVAVERYIYFPSSRASLGLKGPSLMDTGRDEDPEKGMLMVALDVLSRVHAAVMRALQAPPVPLPDGGGLVYRNWDVRHALAEERQKVLRGCVLVFTRVIPLEMEPSSHGLWRLAQSFGAVCSTVLDAATTHVVAGAAGTEKVLQARAQGKWVVTPAWLECSCVLWKRASEERFRVPP